MQEMQVWSLGQEDPLEWQMATHSSTLVWWIPWTEEPDGQQSLGSPRVRHHWVTKHAHISLSNTSDYKKELYSKTSPPLWDSLQESEGDTFKWDAAQDKSKSPWFSPAALIVSRVSQSLSSNPFWLLLPSPVQGLCTCVPFLGKLFLHTSCLVNSSSSYRS